MRLSGAQSSPTLAAADWPAVAALIGTATGGGGKWRVTPASRLCVGGAARTPFCTGGALREERCGGGPARRCRVRAGRFGSRVALTRMQIPSPPFQPARERTPGFNAFPDGSMGPERCVKGK